MFSPLDQHKIKMKMTTRKALSTKAGMLLLVVALIAIICPHVVTGKAILGVDLGNLFMKVALVQRGSPLEIVTNMHSKRKTEQMILFDSGTRFYGADASSLLARKPKQTPVQMTMQLGRDEEHPVVKVRAACSPRRCGSLFRASFDSFSY